MTTSDEALVDRFEMMEYGEINFTPSEWIRLQDLARHGLGSQAQIEALEETNTQLRKDCLNVLMAKLPMTHAIITMLDESEIDVHGIPRELIVNWIVTAQTRIEVLEEAENIINLMESQIDQPEAGESYDPKLAKEARAFLAKINKE
jgi:hypothetical protein